MSYVIIKKDELRTICCARLAWALKDRERAEIAAREEARSVWWRNLLRLPLLTPEKAWARLERSYADEMFGGTLGSIHHTLCARRQHPERLLAACNTGNLDFVILSTEDAERVQGWKEREA